MKRAMIMLLAVVMVAGLTATASAQGWGQPSTGGGSTPTVTPSAPRASSGGASNSGNWERAGTYIGAFWGSFNAADEESYSFDGSAAGLTLGAASISKFGFGGFYIGGDLDLGLLSTDEDSTADDLFLFGAVGYFQYMMFLGPQGNLALSFGLGLGYQGLIGDFGPDTITYNYVPLKAMVGAKLFLQNLMLYVDLVPAYQVGVSVTIDNTTYDDLDPIDLTSFSARVGVSLMF